LTDIAGNRSKIIQLSIVFVIVGWCASGSKNDLLLNGKPKSPTVLPEGCKNGRIEKPKLRTRQRRRARSSGGAGQPQENRACRLRFSTTS